MSNHAPTQRVSKSYKLFLCQISVVFIPRQLQDALVDTKWTKAMAEEMKALKKNDIWDVVPLPPINKTIWCKWIFTIKHKVDGLVERYRAILVANRYT